MWPVSPRWSGQGNPVSRIEIWSKGKYIDTTTDYRGGSVTEKRGNGIRSTLSLTIRPSSQWQAWLDLPALWLLPFAGFSWGVNEELVPLGVFPVRRTTFPSPPVDVTLSAADQWQLVMAGDFTGKVSAAGYAGLTRDAIAQLLMEVDISAGAAHPVTKDPLRVPLVTATSTAQVDTSLVWDKRQDSIFDMAETISAEVYVDRVGQPVVRDIRTVPGTPLLEDTVMTINPSVDWSDVVNTVIVSSSNSKVVFDPAIVSITDPTHPAHMSNIGLAVLRIQSNNLADRNQAFAMASSELAKRSGPALGWTLQCLPDPSCMPGDQPESSVAGVPVVVTEVTHPLGDGGRTVKLGAL